MKIMAERSAPPALGRALELRLTRVYLRPFRWVHGHGEMDVKARWAEFDGNVAV